MPPTLHPTPLHTHMPPPRHAQGNGETCTVPSLFCCSLGWWLGQESTAARIAALEGSVSSEHVKAVDEVRSAEAAKKSAIVRAPGPLACSLPTQRVLAPCDAARPDICMQSACVPTAWHDPLGRGRECEAQGAWDL